MKKLHFLIFVLLISGHLFAKPNIDYILQSIEFVKKIDGFGLTTRAIHQLKSSQDDFGNYEKVDLTDSVLQADKQHKLDSDHRAELQNKNSSRNIVLISGILLLILALGLWSRFRFIRKTNLKLSKEKERAEESERFKQQFLANMSHEIRTPMNAVLGMTYLTLDTKLTQKQSYYLNAVKKSSENLLVIINDILDLTKLESGKMDLEKIPFSLKEQIKQVHDTLRFKAEEKGLLFSTHFQDDLPRVLLGDPLRLNQVLINLCSNAIKFTTKGSVEVRVERVEDTKATLRFRVIDTGIGIQKDKFDILFNAFQQADTSISRKYGGTGLGLTISKTLVELQRGEMSFKSESGVGSEFFFTIPYSIASDDQIAELDREQQTDTSALQGIRILLAEDNEYNRIVVKDTLVNLIDDITIDQAINGKEAILMHEANTYDLILMDAHMPEMDGLEATRFIRQKFEGPKKDIVIIALTASVLNQDIKKCMDVGMNDSVPKPFKREQLISTLSRYYQRKEQIKKNTSLFVKKEFHKQEKKKIIDGKLTDLEFLQEFCNNDQNRVDKYISMYIKSTPKNLERINLALDENDFSTIKTVVHSMKPHLNFMGMEKTREIADRIEGGNAISEDQENNELTHQVNEFIKDCKLSIKELS